MARIGVQMEMDPEIMRKLGAGEARLWTAAGDDGSGNRINGEAVLEAAELDTSLGILTAVFQWIRKAFRNRGKTRDDFAAEKEAAHINRACDALEAMLLDYFRAAKEGALEEETLEELLAALEEMQGYAQAGKLKIPGERELNEISRRIGEYTAAMTGEKAGVPSDSANQFSLIREQLIRQKKWLGQKGFI